MDPTHPPLHTNKWLAFPKDGIAVQMDEMNGV